MRFTSTVSQLAGAAILLLAVTIMSFIMIHAAPGDTADVIAGEMGGITPEMRDEIRTNYGLDRPLLEQLALHVKRLAVGDLGKSYYYNQSVLSLIGERILPTLLLVLTAFLFALVIGTLLGTIAARNPKGALSALVTLLSLVGFSAPVFWSGMLLLVLFGKVIPLFPIQGILDPALLKATLPRQVVNVAQHLVLPALTLALTYVAQYSRLARSSMLEVLSSDYIRTARAKGLPETVVVYKHALRNALIPVVTVAGVQLSHLLSGAVLVETVFSWPGLGRLAYDAVVRRDAPLLMGILFISAVVVIVVNLLTDIVYRMIDPRVGSA